MARKLLLSSAIPDKTLAMRRINVFFIVNAILLVIVQRLPGASHWADLDDRNVIGEWQSCGPKACTSTNIKPDHTFIFTNLSSGKIGYSGDWRTSGNMLLLHVTRTGTAPVSVKGQTIPLIVMDLGPNKMYTRFPSGDTSKHLWTRRK